MVLEKLCTANLFTFIPLTNQPLPDEAHDTFVKTQYYLILLEKIKRTMETALIQNPLYFQIVPKAA